MKENLRNWQLGAELRRSLSAGYWSLSYMRDRPENRECPRKNVGSNARGRLPTKKWAVNWGRSVLRCGLQSRLRGAKVCCGVCCGVGRCEVGSVVPKWINNLRCGLRWLVRAPMWASLAMSVTWCVDVLRVGWYGLRSRLHGANVGWAAKWAEKLTPMLPPK